MYKDTQGDVGSYICGAAFFQHCACESRTETNCSKPEAIVINLIQKLPTFWEGKNRNGIMFKCSPFCFVLQHSPIQNTLEFMSLLKVRSHNVHSMLPVNLNELLLCFLSDYYNRLLEKRPLLLKHMYYEKVQNQSVSCPGRFVQLTETSAFQNVVWCPLKQFGAMHLCGTLAPALQQHDSLSAFQCFLVQFKRQMLACLWDCSALISTSRWNQNCWGT